MKSSQQSSNKTSAPDKGSFPIDHFGECAKEAEKYRSCLMQSSNIPKKCKEEAKHYLQCRMDLGLMAQQSMDELGFVEESSWKYEQMSQDKLAEKVQNIMRESRKRVWEEYLKSNNKPQS